MKIKLTFVADDGMEFENEEECVKHDLETSKNFRNLFPNGFAVFDKHYVRLPDNLEHENDAYHILLVDTKKANDFFRTHSKPSGFINCIGITSMDATPIGILTYSRSVLPEGDNEWWYYTSFNTKRKIELMDRMYNSEMISSAK